MSKKLWKIIHGEPYFINPKKGGIRTVRRNKKRGKIRSRKVFRVPIMRPNPRPLILSSSRRGRIRRRRNPDYRAFSKRVSGVAVGALTPIVLSAILPFDFASKSKNFIRDLLYVGAGYSVAMLVKKFKPYANYFAVGGVAGTIVNYTKDRILELGFIKGLQSAQALPAAQPTESAKGGFYFAENEEPINFLKDELNKKGLPPVVV